MDYNHLASELEKASLFDLWRLNCVIRNLLENPQKLDAIKKNLHKDQKISYFESAENRLVEATVIRIKQKQVLVRNKHDSQQWNIPFYMVNLDSADTSIQPQSTNKLDRQSLQVGSLVGWRTKNGDDQYGKIIKLNPKLAKIHTAKDEVWRVHYSLLFAVTDGATDSSCETLYIEDPHSIDS